MVPPRALGAAIQGRILERAGLKPVPGAVVRLLGRSGLEAVTDAQGGFRINTNASAVRGLPPLRERLAGPGRRTLPSERVLWTGPDGDRDAIGRRIAGGPDEAVLKGPSGPATAGAAPVGPSAELDAAGTPAAKAAAAAAGPGPLEVTCPGLVAKQVAVDADSADLGDIVLDYPPRKFDIGVKPIYGALVLFDGTRERMDSEWEHWMGTYRKTNGLGPTPIVWKFAADPVDPGMAMQTCCRAQWGDEDLVTKRKFRDFQLHVEFNLMAPRAGTPDPANSGVYLQSLYEIQIKDDYGMAVLGNHDAAGILNETAAPENLSRPKGQWQAYDITYRAARFKNGARTEKARLTLYWNGKLVHRDKETANEHNTGVSSDSLTDAPHGLKLQSEGHDVRFRNVWLKELDLAAPNTDLGY
jgi:hypothetical protein